MSTTSLAQSFIPLEYICTPLPAGQACTLTLGGDVMT